jgi:hypothetical protein
MFAIDVLPARHGDALVIEYGTRSDHRRILVDAGTIHSWPDVRSRLAARHDARFDLFVVTHVDEDHIGGAVALLDDPGLRHHVEHVWFNGYIHCKTGGSVLGPVHGEMLTERIVSGPYKWNAPFGGKSTIGGPVVVPTKGELPVVNELGHGARMVLLSPTGPKLKRMATVWEKVVECAGLVPGRGSASSKSRSVAPHIKDVPSPPDPIDREWLTVQAQHGQTDGSEANGSSIAFVLEVGRKRLMLAGDAHPDVLAESLRRYGELVGEQIPRIDLVKLPHHGSGANVSEEMLRAMMCDRYVVSSNGENFGHPDDSALARAILRSDRPVTFYCNYASPRTEPWAQRSALVGARFMLPKPGTAGLRVPV